MEEKKQLYIGVSKFDHFACSLQILSHFFLWSSPIMIKNRLLDLLIAVKIDHWKQECEKIFLSFSMFNILSTVIILWIWFNHYLMRQYLHGWILISAHEKKIPFLFFFFFCMAFVFPLLLKDYNSTVIKWVFEFYWHVVL